MPATTTIARPYAKAAFDYAEQHHTTSKWTEFFQFMKALVSEHKVLIMLQDPRIEDQHKLTLLLQLSGDAPDAHMHNFLKVLLHYHRLTFLPAIADLFALFCEEKNKKIMVEIISAFPIKTKQKENLLQALKIRLQKEITPEFSTDKNLIGGLIIRAGDFVIDSSVRTKINRMKKELES